MQAAAATIVASKEGIQQCAIVWHEFPIEKYNKYTELKGKDFGLNELQFRLKQKRDEHDLRMDREGRARGPHCKEAAFQCKH